MTYRELLEFTKNNPGCFQSENQQMAEADCRYYAWVKQSHRTDNSNQKP